MELGKIPCAWRNGYIIPIPKGMSTGAPNPKMLRGISILSVAYKIFCTIVRNRLIEVDEEQNGLRKGVGDVWMIF